MATKIDPFTRPRSVRISSSPKSKNIETQTSRYVNGRVQTSNRWSGLLSPEEANITLSPVVRLASYIPQTRPVLASLNSSRRDVNQTDLESALNARFRMFWYTDLELFDGLKEEEGKDDEKKKDLNIVDWDGPGDPQNPLNWSSRKKWANTSVLSLITLITTLSSSMFAPGVPQVMEEFHSENELLSSLVVSIFILGYVFGPLLAAPLAELFGRLYVYHASHVLFTGFTIACAYSNSLGMLIAFRFLAGVSGSTPVTIGGGSVADMFVPLERGMAMSLWSMGPLLGPVIGPIGGGFLAEAKGWRWVFWLIALAIASLTLVSMLILRESYAPTLLTAKAAHIRRLTGNQDLRSKYYVALSRTAILTRALIRPTKMLIFSPIVLALSCYMALVYGYLYLLFTTLTSVFERTYHFRTSLVGLTYLGLGMGMITGMTAFGFLTDKLLARTSAKSPNRTPKPEDRLPPMLPAAICVPIGLLIYGWSAHYGVQWMIPIIGTTLVGLGLIGTFMPILMYLVDAFTIYAASATAANTVLRSLGGALLPLAGGPMYARLGLGWGNTLLALVAAVGCLLPWVFLKYGERIRMKWPIDL